MTDQARTRNRSRKHARNRRHRRPKRRAQPAAGPQSGISQPQEGPRLVLKRVVGASADSLLWLTRSTLGMSNLGTSPPQTFLHLQNLLLAGILPFCCTDRQTLHARPPPVARSRTAPWSGCAGDQAGNAGDCLADDPSAAEAAHPHHQGASCVENGPAAAHGCHGHVCWLCALIFRFRALSFPHALPLGKRGACCSLHTGWCICIA